MKLFGGFRGERTKGKESVSLSVEPETPETRPTDADIPAAEPLRKAIEPPEPSGIEAETSAPAEPPETAAIEEAATPEAKGRPVMRSPREQAEIEAIIAAYQKKKRRRKNRGRNRKAGQKPSNAE